MTPKEFKALYDAHPGVDEETLLMLADAQEQQKRALKQAIPPSPIPAPDKSWSMDDLGRQLSTNREPEAKAAAGEAMTNALKGLAGIPGAVYTGGKSLVNAGAESLKNAISGKGNAPTSLLAKDVLPDTSGMSAGEKFDMISPVPVAGAVNRMGTDFMGGLGELIGNAGVYGPLGVAMEGPARAALKPFGEMGGNLGRMAGAEGQTLKAGANAVKEDLWPTPPEPFKPARPTRDLVSEPGYLYHATNEENLRDIANKSLKTHLPDYGTDQATWPDGSTQARAYFSPKADVVEAFAPEHGNPVIVRAKATARKFKKESGTGDVYSNLPVKAKDLEVLGEDGRWVPVEEAFKPAEPSLLQRIHSDESGALRVWHGGPHDHDKFSMAHVGTGEGGASYGHGLYFAENKKTGEFYRDQLGDPKVVAGEQEYPVPRWSPDLPPDQRLIRRIADTAQNYPDWSNDKVLDRIQFILEDDIKRNPDIAAPKIELEQLQRLREQGVQTKSGGRLYEVSVDADPSELLDWDAPLNQQPDLVRRALAQHNAAPPPWEAHQITPEDVARGTIPDAEPGQWAVVLKDGGGNINSHGGLVASQEEAVARAAARNRVPGSAGHDLYRALGIPQDASAKLRDAGVKGLRYLDQGSRIGGDAESMVANYGSRAKALEVAEQRLKAASMGDMGYWSRMVDQLKVPETRNYVIFDDNIVKILNKYGIAATLAGASGLKAFTPSDGESPVKQAIRSKK